MQVTQSGCVANVTLQRNGAPEDMLTFLVRAVQRSHSIFRRCRRANICVVRLHRTGNAHYYEAER